jgi:hypothetical protein
MHAAMSRNNTTAPQHLGLRLSVGLQAQSALGQHLKFKIIFK